MKKLNRAVWIIGGATLAAAVLIQVLIFWPHSSLAWYQGFYYVLGALGVGALIGAGVCLFSMLKDRRMAAGCMAVPCIGLILSAAEYRRLITHIDISAEIRGLDRFILTPYLICVLLSAVFYLLLRRSRTGAES